MRYLFMTRWSTQVYDCRDKAILEWTKDIELVYHNEFKPFMDDKDAFKNVNQWTRQAIKVGFYNTTNSLRIRSEIKDSGWFSHAQAGNNLARQKYYSQGIVPPATTLSIRKNVEYSLSLLHTDNAQFEIFWEFHYVVDRRGASVRMEDPTHV